MRNTFYRFRAPAYAVLTTFNASCAWSATIEIGRVAPTLPGFSAIAPLSAPALGAAELPISAPLTPLPGPAAAEAAPAAIAALQTAAAIATTSDRDKHTPASGRAFGAVFDKSAPAAAPADQEVAAFHAAYRSEKMMRLTSASPTPKPAPKHREPLFPSAAEFNKYIVTAIATIGLAFLFDGAPWVHALGGMLGGFAAGAALKAHAAGRARTAAEALTLALAAAGAWLAYTHADFRGTLPVALIYAPLAAWLAVTLPMLLGYLRTRIKEDYHGH